MANNSWIDMELSAVFGGWTLQETEPAIESRLSEQDEKAVMLELARIERVVAERRAAIFSQSAAKSRAFKALRSHRIAGA